MQETNAFPPAAITGLLAEAFPACCTEIESARYVDPDLLCMTCLCTTELLCCLQELLDLPNPHWLQAL